MMLEFHICTPIIMAMPVTVAHNAPPNEIAILTVMVALNTKNVRHHIIQEIKSADKASYALHMASSGNLLPFQALTSWITESESASLPISLRAWMQ